MTTQISDRITYGGFEYLLPDFPLESLWMIKGMRSPFSGSHTANHRGYQASWIVKENHLLLESVSYYSNEEEQWLDALPKLFPGAKAPVWAHWYSGQIRFGIKPKRSRPPSHWEVRFELENKLTFKNGKVVDENLFFEVARRPV